MSNAIAPETRVTSAGQAGFTLLEVTVALIIAMLALGVLYLAALNGPRSAEVAARYEQAMSRARSRLVIATSDSALTAGDLRGDDGGGFAWRVLTVPISTTSVPAPGVAALRHVPDFRVTLYAVSVWISWRDFGRQRVVRLDTEQIGQPARQP